jgi:hypothetical protein
MKKTSIFAPSRLCGEFFSIRRGHDFPAGMLIDENGYEHYISREKFTPK